MRIIGTGKDLWIEPELTCEIVLAGQGTCRVYIAERTNVTSVIVAALSRLVTCPIVITRIGRIQFEDCRITAEGLTMRPKLPDEEW